MSEICNAVIKATNLGVQYTDHGVLSFWLFLDYGGAGQGYGGIILNGNVVSSLLYAIDKVFQKDWEKLPTTPCRALIDDSRSVGAVGNHLRDLWLWYDVANNEFVVGKLSERLYEGAHSGV